MNLHLCLHLMKATVLSSYFINIHQALSAPAMSTDVSQVSVALFPSVQNIDGMSGDICPYL